MTKRHLILSAVVLSLAATAGCAKSNQSQEPWDAGYFKQERQRSTQMESTLRQRLGHTQADR